MFLYTHGRRPIEGGTRFQKLVFLAQQEHGLEELYEYDSDQFGPFSVELHKDLHRLEALGLAEKQEIELPNGNTRYDFRITQFGIERIQRLLQDGGGNDLFDSVQECKEEFNNWSLSELLRYVYNRYEEYTDESKLSESDLEDSDSHFEWVEPEELPALSDEPAEKPYHVPEVDDWSVIQTHVLNEYLGQVRDIPEVTKVYLEERDNERDRIVTVIETLDFEAMDTIFEIERDIRREFDYPEVSFHVVPENTTNPPVREGAIKLM